MLPVTPQRRWDPSILRALAALALAAASLGLNAGASAAAGIEKGPYLQKPAPGGITVCWVTAAECTGTVRVRRTAHWPRRSRTFAVRETLRTRYHKVPVTGLLPHQRYLYTVECDREKRGGAFRTAASEDQAFRFAVYGDNRTNGDVHAAVLAQMMRFRPDFVVNTGDLVADGRDEALWSEFFRTAGPALAQTPYYPALGNHERDGAAYLRYFAVPRDYSFDYGDIHFAALDSNRPPAEQAAQTKWLRQDLAAHQGAVWRVVFFHHTPYTCVNRRGRRELAEKLRARLEPVFLEGNVQLVLNGHDHDYQHHLAHGIHYLVTGGGGAPLYDVYPDTPFVLSAVMAHHHCEITVRGRRMTVRAVEPDGNELDRWTIEAWPAERRSAAPVRRPLPGDPALRAFRS